MRYFLICNPGSRHGVSKGKFERIFILFRQNNLEYECKIINSLQEAEDLSSMANRNGYDVVVAIGGDGTINRVLNGFFNQAGGRISAAALGIIYTGTSPDFCKSYNIPIEIEPAVKILAADKRVSIRVGRISYAKSPVTQLPSPKAISEKRDQHTAYFGCCANIGLGATLARYANGGIRKYLGDSAGTFFSLLRTLACYQPVDLIVQTDGCCKNLNQVHNISIGRTTWLASGIKVHNDLKADEPRFYSLAVHSLKMHRLPMILKAIYSGKPIVSSQSITFEYAEVLQIDGPHSVEVEFDGDPAGYLPCRIEPAKDLLDLVVL
ncbi:MAG: diacylglycerol kinase [Proteobacteria bacterium]|nr:diacylglycerol kinase [Pseudomonadota bacterium]MBU1689067.1 diacylglycerol kinase [Pseudomonadota bacterium]